MRLTCQSCNARFTIADKRVRGRILHVRCRHCGAVLEARLRSQIEGEQADAAWPDPAGKTGQETGPPPLPVRKWFAVLNGQRVGPLSTDELHLRISRGELSAENLVWRRGFKHWRPLLAIKELRAVVGVARTPADSGKLPALPERRRKKRRGRTLRLIPGSTASTRSDSTRTADALALARQRTVASSSAHAQHALMPTTELPQARWPLWLALLGGLMMLSSAAMLLWRRSSTEGVEESSVPQRGEQISPARPLGHQAEMAPASRPTREYPALEVQHARREVPAAKEELPDPRPVLLERWSSKGVPPRHRTKPDDLKTTLAMRIYRRNRASLEACDTLAEKRGEPVSHGSRAEFQVQISASGTLEVKVNARGLSPSRLACYRAVSQHWRVPITGTGYSTTFEHIH